MYYLYKNIFLITNLVFYLFVVSFVEYLVFFEYIELMLVVSMLIWVANFLINLKINSFKFTNKRIQMISLISFISTFLGVCGLFVLFRFSGFGYEKQYIDSLALFGDLLVLSICIRALMAVFSDLIISIITRRS